MMDYTMRLYNEFLEDSRTDLSYHFSPRLQVATTEEGAEKLRVTFEETLGVTSKTT
jgi:hypothetical protein